MRRIALLALLCGGMALGLTGRDVRTQAARAADEVQLRAQATSSPDVAGVTLLLDGERVGGLTYPTRPARVSRVVLLGPVNGAWAGGPPIFGFATAFLRTWCGARSEAQTQLVLYRLFLEAQVPGRSTAAQGRAGRCRVAGSAVGRPLQAVWTVTR